MRTWLVVSAAKAAQVSVVAPPGMKLVAACGAEKLNGSWSGGFYFTGRYVVSGVVKREDDDWFGDSLWFEAESKRPGVQFFDAGKSLRFLDDSSANRRFRASPPTDGARCWSARVTIEVRVLHVLAGGTDQDGGFPLQYRVSRLGKYQNCRQSAPVMGAVAGVERTTSSSRSALLSGIIFN